MLNRQISDEILELVRQKPRTVQEIAVSLQKNWRTADRYIDTISIETGLISTRTFREGTRGALKIVHWNALDTKGSAYQEQLMNKILLGRKKEDFSPLDIYQFAAKNKRECFVEEQESPQHPKARYARLIDHAKNQVLWFSGNLSWTELEKKDNIFHRLELAAKKKVSIKILTRIDLTSKEIVQRLLAINRQAGWDAIEIRHSEQPLRAMLADDACLAMKEILHPSHFRPGELRKQVVLYYYLEDQEWVQWVQKVFWHLFRQSVDVATRLEALNSLDYQHVFKRASEHRGK